ncbi:alanine racemase [Salinispirillum sp. LH 10-3-1]|uniref:Alanine racemase n=1 Tax=Salinispirillum sp. LH 10-3-1 TaxID=2952525 RepID=A0AB38YBG0_9GAMM
MSVSALGAALKKHGVERPALVLDWQAFQHNLTYLNDHLPTGYHRRIADKSLPSLDLLDRVLAGLHTQAIMSFHLPMTQQVLARFPHLDVLMGKPMPVGEVQRFLSSCSQAAQVTWLIDSEQRLAEYRALADSGPPLRVAFEIDIGLGRGGFADPSALARAASNTGALTVAGVMGYEAHVNALPSLLGRGARAQREAQARLQAFVDQLPMEARQIINTGGSMTALMLPKEGPGNDLTIGSAVVKPSHFDQSCNQVLKPALFVVTPVLKVHPHGLPGFPRLSKGLRRLHIIAPDIAFIYGGNWLAKPVWPFGLNNSPFYGPSSNQQGFTLPRGATTPSHVVLRPTQSEALISHFPCIWVYRDGQISEQWPTLPPLA